MMSPKFHPEHCRFPHWGRVGGKFYLVCCFRPHLRHSETRQQFNLQHRKLGNCEHFGPLHPGRWLVPLTFAEVYWPVAGAAL